MFEPKGWLAKLQARDEVAIRHGGVTTRFSIARIDKLTATQIVIGQMRFSRKDGWEIGNRGGFHRSHITEATPLLRDSVERSCAVESLKYTPWHKLRLDKLRQIIAIVEAP